MVPKFLSKHVFYPLWDVYDNSVKLKEMKRLSRAQCESYEVKRQRQLNNLKQMTAYAVENCEYYKGKKLPQVHSFEDFTQWPLLTKRDIQLNMDRLISNKYKKSDLVSAKTGGSTGTSLEVFFDIPCQEKRNAMALHCDRWSGWDLGDYVGALWGNPPEIKTTKEWIRNKCLDRMIYLDTVEMTDKSMEDFLNKIRDMKIHFLFGHAHSIFILAQYLLKNKLDGLDIRGIISTSMMLLSSERKTIEAAFGCLVTDRYGCEEVGLIAAQTEQHEGMLINMDHLLVEVLRQDGTPACAGEEGDIVVTDLINFGMPLIRYQVGDVGILSTKACSAGRANPMLEKIVGRTADFLVRADGALVAGVSLVERTLTAIPGISQMQIIQTELNRISVKVVPGQDYNQDSERRLIEEIKKAFTPLTEVEALRVQKLDPSKNGKYRFSICHIANPYQEAATK